MLSSMLTAIERKKKFERSSFGGRVAFPLVVLSVLTSLCFRSDLVLPWLNLISSGPRFDLVLISS
jgi:hypothetical protein